MKDILRTEAHEYLQITEDHLLQWAVKGHYFGYPPCCIHSFCQLNHYGKNNVQTYLAAGNGFVPCINCAKRVASGEIQLSDLIVNRKSILPFPIDTGDEVDEYFEQWLESFQ